MSPKRKPLMIETPKSATKQGGSSTSSTPPPRGTQQLTNDKSSASKGGSSSSSSSRPPPPWQPYPHDYRGRGGGPGEDGGMFSPYPEAGSMQPPQRYHPSQQQQTTAAAHSQAAMNEDDEHQPDPNASMEEEEEDMGADFLSLSNGPVGSFAEYSPPRGGQQARRSSPSSSSKPRQPPQRSPTASYPFGGYVHHPHHHSAPPNYYTKSPRSSHAPPPPPPPHYPGMYSYPGGPPGAGPPPPPPPSSATKGRRIDHPSSAPPPHHYPYPPPGHGYPPPPRYYPYPQQQGLPGDPWTSPQAYETEAFGPAGGVGKENSTNLKDAFRSSPPQGSPRRSSIEGSTTTPEKIAKMRSPFRSPPMSQTKQSPMFRSPGLAGYGSFGMMDTPGGTLAAEFSPMGPMLNSPFAPSFGEHPTPPQLSLSRSNSDEDGMDIPDPSAVNDDPCAAEEGHHSQLVNSPFSGFVNDFHHFPSSSKKSSSNNTGSGGLQGVSRSPLRSERRGASTSDPRADRPPIQHLTSTQPNSSRRPKLPAGAKIMASPLGQSSSAKPRKLWHGPTEPAPGPMRLQLGSTSSLKKSLEGINSMMRGPTGVPMATPSQRPYGHAPPSANYRRLNTPIKLDPSPMHSKTMGLATGNKRTMSSNAKSARDGKIPRSGGKENATTPGTKRSPCNCKKSKCLKLYCECFAAELFCEGCNCTDCQNTDAFAGVRDKAMKDTRAKNPNAFKPRISAKGLQGAIAAQNGHNMGCRCKRSECLKKYCECFQAGVMCGGKCKCVDCMNFAGSQKLIDKRRKIKDQRGAELAMKSAEQAWKGPQHSVRKLPVARPAIHGMRPMPSPVATPGGRLPMAMAHMLHPSPSGNPYMRPMLMGPPHGHMGYSPMGMHPHVSPSAYGMYPPPHHYPPPTPNIASTRKTSPTASATKRAAKAKMTIDRVEMPYTKTVSVKKATPLRKPWKSPSPVKPAVSTEKAKSSTNEGEKASPMAVAKEGASGESPLSIKVAASVDSPLAADDAETTTHKEHPDKPSVQPSPKDRPDTSSVQPTPAETKRTGPAEITPMPATPAPAVRLAYDPSTQKKQRKDGGDVEADALAPYFGGGMCPKQSKTTALAVFSYLSDSELQGTAGLVCKRWNVLAKDEALRQSSSASSRS